MLFIQTQQNFLSRKSFMSCYREAAQTVLCRVIFFSRQKASVYPRVVILALSQLYQLTFKLEWASNTEFDLLIEVKSQVKMLKVSPTALSSVSFQQIKSHYSEI